MAAINRAWFVYARLAMINRASNHSKRGKVGGSNCHQIHGGALGWETQIEACPVCLAYRPYPVRHVHILYSVGQFMQPMPFQIDPERNIIYVKGYCSRNRSMASTIDVFYACSHFMTI